LTKKFTAKNAKFFTLSLKKKLAKLYIDLALRTFFFFLKNILDKFLALFAVKNKSHCTGGGIRTPINGFGDRYSTLELRP
jgi:type II restriction/modification system DNA methylase subunit YeeA